KKETAGKLVRIARESDRIFSGFINGKLIDSLIIGILCFIGMSIIGFDFTLLISFIVGVTNVIPFFGPFFGAIPSVLILLMVDPWQALWFAIFVLVLQQLDGNVIGPKILGDNTGLPALWVMFAILVGGGMFGVIGMFVGVPAFAVIYQFTKEYLENRLKKKNLPEQTESYKVIKGFKDFDDIEKGEVK
ncbi:MAG: AI-2E family transporter, partial [Oscillospiraceae bacterium]|nr:AI-2E family transporter [Oscillospiraceae bacterium]